MPQATDELREEFGIDDLPVCDFLQVKGCRLLLPTYIYVVPDEPGISAKMMRAIQFLHQERDFAGMWLFESELAKGIKDGTLDAQGRILKRKEKDPDDQDC